MASQVESIKWVPGTNFLVDGFAFRSPRCSHYFLTHFHSDHTVGLNKSFNGGVIYCSHVTAQLLVHDMGLKPQLVRPLVVGTPVVIAGVRVTPLDANHCPGAVMFLFEVPLPAAVAADKSRLLPNSSPPAMASTPGLRSRLHAEAPSSPLAPCGAAAVALPAGTSAATQPAAVARDHEAGQSCSRGLAGGGAEGNPVGGEVTASRHLTPPVDTLDKLSAAGDGTAAAAATATAATHNILHTGDCRWQRWMRDQPGLAGVRVDTLMLDTTYAAPKHTLPTQLEAIEMMVQVMREALAAEPRTVFVVAAYHIGKERAFLGAARQLGTRVWCSAAKRAVLRLLDLPDELSALLVDDPRDAAVHVTGWGLRPEDLQAYLERHPGVWKQALGIRPTGWTLRRSGGVSVRREGNVAVVGVPYSEHSSWTDLCDAVSQLRPRALIPTVNAATPAQRRALVDRFAHLMDLSADRSRMDVYLARCALAAGGAEGPAGCEAATGAHCALGSGSTVAGCAETSVTAVRVDLATVDLAEQERILTELQLQQQRRQEQQQQQQRRRSKRRAPSAEEDAGVLATADKRPRMSATPPQQQQQPVGRDRAGADHTAAKRARSSVARGRAVCSSRSSIACSSGGGSGVAVTCVIDLSQGFDDDEAEEEDGGGARTVLPAEAGASRGEEQSCPGSCMAARRPACSSWAADTERAGTGRVGGGGSAPSGQQTPLSAAAPAPPRPSPPVWQSSIRRFFAPVGRVAAALFSGRESGVCMQEA